MPGWTLKSDHATAKEVLVTYDTYFTIRYKNIIVRLSSLVMKFIDILLLLKKYIANK